MSSQTYLYLANAVLLAHVGVVLFIVAGLVMILLGGRFDWVWVRNFWFRVMHIGGILYVVMESWLGIACPLTNLEQSLRERAGKTGHGGDFIAFWLGKLLFYQAAPWVFIAAYSAFAVLVIYSWVIVRPNNPRSRIVAR